MGNSIQPHSRIPRFAVWHYVGIITQVIIKVFPQTLTRHSLRQWQILCILEQWNRNNHNGFVTSDALALQCGCNKRKTCRGKSSPAGFNGFNFWSSSTYRHFSWLCGNDSFRTCPVPNVCVYCVILSYSSIEKDFPIQSILTLNYFPSYLMLGWWTNSFRRSVFLRYIPSPLPLRTRYHSLASVEFACCCPILSL